LVKKQDQEFFRQLRELLEKPDDRPVRAGRLARLIRDAGAYRWVGIYEVSGNEIAVVAWSGAGSPAFPRFPINQGLCGAAVASGTTVRVGNVAKDPRYLTTFGSTRSEIVIPLKHSSDGKVVGLIDAESEQLNAFTDDDQTFLEECARLTAAFWE
jgi:GAF domain-containing protein